MSLKIDGHEITIGSYVCFKSDIEQSGKVVKINGNRLTISNEWGFDGGYIGGQTEVVVEARDCWVEG